MTVRSPSHDHNNNSVDSKFNFALRIVVSLLFFTGFVANLAFLIVAAVSGIGLDVLLYSDGWAFAALMDYIGGTGFVMAYFYVISPNIWVGLLAAVLSTVLGSGFTYLVMAYRVISITPKTKSLYEVILAKPDQKGSSNVSLRVFQVYSLGCIITYFFFVAKAIMEETLIKSAAIIMTDTWSFFVQVL